MQGGQVEVEEGWVVEGAGGLAVVVAALEVEALVEVWAVHRGVAAVTTGALCEVVEEAAWAWVEVVVLAIYSGNKSI